jgi:hypothetical protein
MKRWIVSSLALACTGAFAQTARTDLPPNPKLGECYARVVVPPRYETLTEQVVTREASRRVEVVPARYEADTETVVVREAAKRIEVIPATYRNVTEEIVVRPASKRLEVVPATYENVTERVLVREAYTTWKRGSAWLPQAKAVRTGAGVAVQGDAAARGLEDDVLCLVEIPAEYRTVTRRVEKTPATTREVEVPAVTRTVTRRVVDQPASTREVDVPEVTQTVKVTKMVEAPKEVMVDVPAQYGTVTRTKLVSEAKVEWRSILCDTNATPAKIMEIQRALQSAGFNPGRIDGVIRQDTMAAVNAFQRARNLPVDPYLNVETVQALGVSPR